MNIPGIEKPSLQELPRLTDRITFIYVEHCQLNREDSAIVVRDEHGSVRIPAAIISVLLLGPGTQITHRAIELIGDAGVTVIWIGEHGVRFYASGRPLTTRSGLLEKQAKMFGNQRLHLDVVRKMYRLRFPDEETGRLTLQQLRGREGSRMRAAYKRAAEQWGIAWSGRKYDPEHFEEGTPVNQALSAGNACLYGLAHAVIAGLGCSPGLGFIHVGHERSFVYDLADLYKAEIVIPIAFEAAAKDLVDLPAEVRRRVRDAMVTSHLLERMVKDVRYLFSQEETEADRETEVVYLWGRNNQLFKNGRNYSEAEGDVTW